jgi:hypothetical protein
MGRQELSITQYRGFEISRLLLLHRLLQGLFRRGGLTVQ